MVRLQGRLRQARHSVLFPTEPRAHIGGLPHQDGFLRVERVQGRGDIDVIEQPTASNGYHATLRVRDPRSGADNYRIIAYWQPVYNNGRYDR